VRAATEIMSCVAAVALAALCVVALGSLLLPERRDRD